MLPYVNCQQSGFRGGWISEKIVPDVPFKPKTQLLPIDGADVGVGISDLKQASCVSNYVLSIHGIVEARANTTCFFSLARIVSPFGFIHGSIDGIRRISQWKSTYGTADQ